MEEATGAFASVTCMTGEEEEAQPGDEGDKKVVVKERAGFMRLYNEVLPVANPGQSARGCAVLW